MEGNHSKNPIRERGSTPLYIIAHYLFLSFKTIDLG